MKKEKKIITSDDILGKEAVDPVGSIIGVVTKLHLSQQKKELIGITIDLGFLKPDLFVGIDHVKQFGIDAILINKTPLNKFKGLKVLTSYGKEIGTVKQAISNRHKVKELIVNVKGSGLMKIEKKIPMNKIKTIGSSVILK